MKTKLLYLSAAIVLFAAHTSEAQNLDPTVEVRKDYEGKLLVVHKPVIEMAVPDSVYRFDLDFDYSVSDTPYKGAYEFIPYSMDMKPAPTQREVSDIYLKAGAGYQLHPMLDFLWSPKFEKPLTLDVYGSNRSYIGKYWSMPSPDLQTDKVIIIDSDNDAPVWSGYDLSTQGGVSGRYDWKNAMFVFGAGVTNLMQKENDDIYGRRAYNSADVNVGLKSKDPHSVGMEYAVGLDYRFTDDQVGYADDGVTAQRAHDLNVRLDMESSLSGGHNMSFDALFSMTENTGALNVSAGSLEFSPHYVIKTSRWNVDLGVRFASVFRTDSTDIMYSHKEQTIYPDCRVEFSLFPNLMKVYADIGGGCEMNTYSSLVRNDRRFNPYYGRGVWDVLDVTDERLTAELGFEGNITSRFGYILRGGYTVYGNAPLPVIYVSDKRDRYIPGLGYTAYNKAYAALDFMFDKKPLRIDGCLMIDAVTSMGSSFAHKAGFILPSVFKGDIAASYNFNDRIFISIDCEFSTDRDGYIYADKSGGSAIASAATIPGYADLGAEAEYRFNRKMSFWARGGNLLGMTIQRELLYAEKGPYFTAGICLNL